MTSSFFTPKMTSLPSSFLVNLEKSSSTLTLHPESSFFGQSLTNCLLSTKRTPSSHSIWAPNWSSITFSAVKTFLSLTFPLMCSLKASVDLLLAKAKSSILSHLPVFRLLFCSIWTFSTSSEVGKLAGREKSSLLTGVWASKMAWVALNGRLWLLVGVEDSKMAWVAFKSWNVFEFRSVFLDFFRTLFSLSTSRLVLNTGEPKSVSASQTKHYFCVTCC